jgi:HEAT repeat protein
VTTETLFSLIGGLEDISMEEKEIELAVERIAAICRKDQSLIPVLVRFLGTGVWSAREAVARAISILGALAEPHLIEALTSENPETTVWALGILEKAGSSEAIPHIIRATEKSSSKIRVRALSAITAIGKWNSLDFIFSQIHDPQWIISKKAFTCILQLLNDSQDKLEKQKNQDSEKSPPYASPVLEACSRLLASGDPDVHYWGLRILSAIPGNESTNRIIEYLNRPKSPMAHFAIRELAEKKDSRSTDIISPLLNRESDWFKARNMAAALAVSPTEEGIASLVSLMERGDPVLSSKAAVSLSRLGPMAEEKLLEIISERNDSVARWASVALGMMASEKASEHLFKWVCREMESKGDPSVPLEVLALVPFTARADDKFMAVMENMLQSNDWFLRLKAVEVLGPLVENSGKTINEIIHRKIKAALSRAASDSNWLVRSAVFKAIN